MANEPGRDHGKQIGDIVRSALQSGDLSRLKDLGPAVQDVVQDGLSAAGLNGQPAPDNQQQPPPQQQQQPPPPPPAWRGQQQGGQARPMWQGSAPLPVVGTPAPGKRTGTAMLALGVLGMAVFALCAIIFVAVALITGQGGTFWPLAIGCGAAFVACGAVARAGTGRRQLAARLREYRTLLERKPVYTFNELAAQLGREAGEIKKDFRRAGKKNLLPDVRTDRGETCVIRGEEAWRQYQQAEEARVAREQEEAERQRRLGDPATAGIEQFKSEGEATIRKIRQANDAIPGEEISEKLVRLEKITARIFAYVEAHPGKLPDTRKFLNYYLPTTLKLVEKYRQYEALEVQPANVQQAKADIANTLDTIDTAFNNLLESLYQEDTLDVTTDIEVLQKMLEQEGLTGKEFEID